MKRFGILAVTVASLFTVSTPAFGLSLTLENKTGKELHELYFVAAGETEWGPDQLGDETVQDGATFTLNKIKKGKYDVMFVDENQKKCDLRDVDFTTSEVFVMTKKVIRGCQENSDQAEED